tara:strand:+ start:43347 stop:44216 length:870 start_codon:yes stop_codon:yes gene_type:complete
MIYDEPKYTPGGDRYIEMELGNELNFDLNFLVHSLTKNIRDSKINGILELLPNMASIVMAYNPDQISFDDLTKETTNLYRSLGSLESIELISPVFTIPVLYFDHRTKECWEDYCKTIQPKTYDPDLMVELNKLSDKSQLKRIHSGTEYWVAALGFYPGLASLISLDPRCRLTAPKYNPPRTWTPKGTVGYGGSVTCVYPDQTPGGYQIIGHTPAPVCDLKQRLPAFRKDVALLRPGDRVRFVPIELNEYEYIEAHVAEGTYSHNIARYSKFSIKQYHAWIKSLDEQVIF